MLEIVVIGAGIAGSAVALALRERGAAVTVVDTSRPGAGATGASAGMVVAQYESAGPSAKFDLCLESRSRYPEYARKLQELSGRDLHFRRDGMLVANLDEAEHAAAQDSVRWQVEAGLRAEILEPAEAEKLQPGVSRDVASYIWLPDEGQLDSQILAEGLADAIASADVRLISDNGAAGILQRSGSVSGIGMADGRTLEADQVVVAAGAWNCKVDGQARMIPVRPMRGQILRLPLQGLPLKALVASHAGRYLVPRDDGTVLVGSTMEDVGFDRAITDEGERLIHESIAELVPELKNRNPTERWAGLRPICDDSLPVIGPDPDLGGLFYATGYGRDGILIAPLVGEIVADLMVSGASEFAWHAFRPDRFSKVG
jgi:glycine oxidase